MTVMDCLRTQNGQVEMLLTVLPAYIVLRVCVIEKLAKGGTLHFQQRSSLGGLLEKCSMRIRPAGHNILMKRVRQYRNSIGDNIIAPFRAAIIICRSRQQAYLPPSIRAVAAGILLRLHLPLFSTQALMPCIPFSMLGIPKCSYEIKTNQFSQFKFAQKSTAFIQFFLLVIP